MDGVNMKRPLFQQIYCEITNECNLSCPFCSISKRPIKYMSLEEFREVVQKIKPYTDSIYLHVKGEPLLHPLFKEFIKCLEEEDLKVKVTTNGTKLLEYSDVILNNPIVKRINISLQSIINFTDEETTNYFLNLEQFIKLNKTTHIYLRNWASNTNEDNVIKEYIKKMYPNAAFVDNENLSDYVHYSYQTKFTWPSENKEETIESNCLGGKMQLAILSDGTVTLCCLDSEGDTKIGNIFENTLEEILDSPLYKKAVSEMPYFALCKKCSYRLKFKGKEMKQS